VWFVFSRGFFVAHATLFFVFFVFFVIFAFFVVTRRWI